jgi:hypothetical protein
MKKILSTILILTSLVSNAQFKKTTTSDKYIIIDSVKIKNGHNEYNTITVKGMFPQKIWDDYVIKQKTLQDSLNTKYSKNYITTDSSVFTFLIQILSIKASGSGLKYPDSFIPLNEQFFSWYEKENSFMCNYKMMARNGYGNLTETSALVMYKIK